MAKTIEGREGPHTNFVLRYVGNVKRTKGDMSERRVCRGSNNAQVAVLSVAGALLVLMLAIPPWRMRQVELGRQFRTNGWTEWQVVRRKWSPTVYAPAWRQPAGIDTGDFQQFRDGTTGPSRTRTYQEALGINFYVLAVQVFCLALMTGLAMYVFRQRQV